MAKRRRARRNPKKMKILGMSIPMVVAIGAGVWYFFLRKKGVTTGVGV